MEKNELTWEEIRSLIIDSGKVTAQELSGMVEKQRERMSAFIDGEEFLYLYVAKKLGVSMPEVNNIPKKAVEAKNVTCAKVGPLLEGKKFIIEGVVTSVTQRSTKAGGLFTSVYIADATGSTQLQCFRDTEVAEKLLTIEVGKVYKFTDVNVWHRADTYNGGQVTNLTIGDWSKFESSSDNINDVIPNYVNGKPVHGGYVSLTGIATKDDNFSYLGCTGCRQSAKRGDCTRQRCMDNDAQQGDITIYKFIVTAGEHKVPVNFMFDYPGDIIGSLITVVGEWDSGNSEIMCRHMNVSDEEVIPEHAATISGIASQATVQEHQATAVEVGGEVPTEATKPQEAVQHTPTEVVNSCLARFGSNARIAVQHKLVNDAGLTSEDAEAFITGYVEAGIIGEEGSMLVWLNGDS